MHISVHSALCGRGGYANLDARTDMAMSLEGKGQQRVTLGHRLAHPLMMTPHLSAGSGSAGAPR